jgi:hypothetical protein
MSSVDEAAAAIQGLHEQHTWQGMTQPMVSSCKVQVASSSYSSGSSSGTHMQTAR